MSPDPHDPASIANFVRRQERAIVATVSRSRHPEAALVGIAALDDGRLIFDAPISTRKIDNLRGDEHVAVVVGTTGEVSIQLEGTAFIAEGADRQLYGAEYNAQFPGSRALHPEFAVVVIRPNWVRVYDTSTTPAHVREARW